MGKTDSHYAAGAGGAEAVAETIIEERKKQQEILKRALTIAFDERPGDELVALHSPAAVAQYVGILFRGNRELAHGIEQLKQIQNRDIGATAVQILRERGVQIIDEPPAV